MNKRMLAYSVLGFVLFGGLLSGLFADSIQRALALPLVREQGVPSDPKRPIEESVSEHGTVIAQDTFQRPDQPMWGIASDGLQWELDATQEQAFSIANNTGQIAHGDSTKPLTTLLGPASPNVEVLMTGMINQFGKKTNFGVMTRWTDAGNWYKAQIDGTHISLLKSTNQKITTIETAPFPVQAGVPHRMRFRALGAMLFIKVWRSNVIEPEKWTLSTSGDTTHTTGRVGVQAVLDPTSTVTIQSFVTKITSIGEDE